MIVFKYQSECYAFIHTSIVARRGKKTETDNKSNEHSPSCVYGQVGNDYRRTRVPARAATRPRRSNVYWMSGNLNFGLSGGGGKC